MTPAALALVLIAAVLHATWNYWAKRAGGGLPFVYLVGILICIGYVPIVAAYLAFYDAEPSLPVLGAIFVSGVLKTGYALFLQRAYRTGDFSLIYPLARGTGPLLAAVGAMLFFAERPTALALCGAVAVVVGIFWIAGGHNWLRLLALGQSQLGKSAVSAAAICGLISGVFIAAYTLWDKHGVAHLMIAPVLYDAGTAYTQLVLLAPFAWKRRGEVQREWKEHRTNAIVMAAISPLGYVLILTAMTFTPVSYVAPAREISILIGMFFGARFLGESGASRRVWPAVLMVAGIFALALG
jgi:drug/metabolite transporter (DMT)-like permease